VNVTDIHDNEESPLHILFLTHECERIVSCTCDRTYRETTPLNLLLTSAHTAHPVLNACFTVFVLTNTVISIDSSV